MKTVNIIPFVILVFCCWGTDLCGQEFQPMENKAHIRVNGEAVVYAKPDKIALSLGIETWDVDITLAKQKNQEIQRKAISVAKAAGVADRGIQTDHLSLEPRYKDEYRRGSILGYFVRNRMTLTLTGIDRVEELVTQLLQAGVNYLHGIDFQTVDFKRYREQARELALLAAKEKAEKMAAVLGQTIGSPLSIQESYSGQPWNYYSSWSGWGWGQASAMTQNVIQDNREPVREDSEPSALGKISIRAAVSVTFELKK